VGHRVEGRRRPPDITFLLIVGGWLTPALGTEVARPDLGSLVLVLGASTLGAIVSRIHGRIVLPTVVVEIVLGIVIGPEVLDIAEVDSYIDFLAQIGLALLFFFAGLEVVEQRVARRSLVRGAFGWGVSLAIGLVVGVVLSEAGMEAEWWLLGVALSTTALGTLVPILSDARLLPTPLGSAALGAGVAGEFWPIVVISVFLTGVYGALEEVLLLIAFGGIVALAAAVAIRARPPRLLRVLRETVHTTGQAAVRASIFLLAVLVLLTDRVGFDFVLGAFAAGLVVGLTLDSPEGATVRMRLEGIGFGLFVPIYFVVAGMTFDLDSFLTATGIALGALFLALFLVVRGIPALTWLRELGRRDTLGLALFSSTALPLIVAIVGIGTDRGAISDGVGASLIGAGMLSVLLFPLLATRIAGLHAVGEPTADAYASPDEY
jgi:Kef-type K+ transport system membrane component KefB